MIQVVVGTFEKTKPTESHQICMLQVYLCVQYIYVYLYMRLILLPNAAAIPAPLPLTSSSVFVTNSIIRPKPLKV